ncbi:hypothetical protein MP638_003343 [Amoeboaphelidium occidentale]|nr:hypothetical protein MP638_003343 [Amoeboaphelidium occidentale]
MGMTLLEQSLAGKSRRKVYYLLSKELAERSQSIYRFFALPSYLFVTCCEEDLRGKVPEMRRVLLEEKLYVFGFIDKLLFGNLYGSKERVGIHQMSGIQLKEKIQRTWKVDERPVVILDEFIPLESSNDKSSSNEKKLTFIRNGFLSVGILTIIMGTDARVANLIKKTDMSRDGGVYNWCHIFSGLPNVLDKFEHKNVSEFSHQVLVHSRPLFAIDTFNLFCSSDPIENDLSAWDEISRELFPNFIAYKKVTRFEAGQMGQVALSLNVFHVGNADGKSTVFIHHHYGRLQVDDKPLILQNNGQLEGEANEWRPVKVFPAPSEDLLLHLVMLGGKGYRSIYKNETPCPFRFRCNDFFNNIDGAMYLQKIDLRNGIQLTEDGMQMEAWLASAICLASRQNGLGGIPLVDFFKNLMYELYDHILDFSNFKLTGLNWVDGFQDIIIPFFSAPNTEWPDFLLNSANTLINMKNLQRCRNSEKMDVSGELGGTGENVERLRGEAKDRKNGLAVSTTLEIFQRIEKKDRITIILTNRAQNSDFETADFEALMNGRSLQDCRFLKLSTVNITASFDRIHDDYFSDSSMESHKRLIVFVETEIETKPEEEGYSLRSTAVKLK